MRALKRIIPALLIVCFLGAAMPVVASTDNSDNYQAQIDWRFVSPKPRPGGGNIESIAITVLPVQPAPLLVLILDWVLGLAD
jgi:hypothetical protein